MSRLNQLGKTATVISTEPDGTIRVFYHTTDVVTIHPDKRVTLNSGGWWTNTTKARMNQAARQFSLNYSVFQRKYKWFVDLSGQEIPFTGNIVELPALFPTRGDVLDPARYPQQV